jgi:anti-sigma factor RsiW
MTHPGELLSAWLDGETTPDEAAAVESHLADCASCRVELDGIHRARSAVRGLPWLDLPSDVVGRVVVPLRRRHRVIVTAAAAAALAGVLGVAGVLGADRPVPLTVSDLTGRYAARSAADPGVVAVKLVPPPGQG